MTTHEKIDAVLKVLNDAYTQKHNREEVAFTDSGGAKITHATITIDDPEFLS
jgi:hypothetical protein